MKSGNHNDRTSALERRVRERTAELSRANEELRDEIAQRKKAERTLREEEEFFRLISENMTDMIAVLDPAGRRLYNSASYRDVLGAPEHLQGTDSFEEIHPGDRTRVRTIFDETVRTGIGRRTQYRFLLPDGSIRLVESQGSVIKDENGKVSKVVVVSRDMTERVRSETEIQELNTHLEQRVTERTAQLESAINELEAFSYSVSHDLRAPLRAIDGFARILEDGFADNLPAEAQRYLSLVRKNTRQMGELIDDLLAFSRLSRQPLNRQTISPEKIVTKAIEDLRSEREGREVDIVIGNLPPCSADPALLKQVLVNLIANALKFTRKRRTATIEIDSRCANGEVEYFIRDNGVGFDPRRAAELFGVFQRLHRAEEYEGTGVGLAIVQRIVHRHGGRVRAESGPDQGAIFYFTVQGAGCS